MIYNNKECLRIMHGESVLNQTQKSRQKSTNQDLKIFQVLGYRYIPLIYYIIC